MGAVFGVQPDAVRQLGRYTLLWKADRGGGSGFHADVARLDLPATTGISHDHVRPARRQRTRSTAKPAPSETGQPPSAPPAPRPKASRGPNRARW